MNGDDRRRRRLDRILAELNRQSAAMHTAMQNPDDEDEPDEEPQDGERP